MNDNTATSRSPPRRFDHRYVSRAVLYAPGGSSRLVRSWLGQRLQIPENFDVDSAASHCQVVIAVLIARKSSFGVSMDNAKG